MKIISIVLLLNKADNSLIRISECLKNYYFWKIYRNVGLSMISYKNKLEDFAEANESIDEIRG